MSTSSPTSPPGQDYIGLDGSIFKDLAKGYVAPLHFQDLSEHAAGPTDRIVYDRAHGDLYYDRDGSGSKYAAVKFAHLDGKAGELRFDKLKSDTYVYADVNGDKKSDFAFHLDDAVTLQKTDFML